MDIELKPMKERAPGRAKKEKTEHYQPDYDPKNPITGWVDCYKNKSKQYGRKGKLYSSVAPVRGEMMLACKAGKVTRNI